MRSASADLTARATIRNRALELFAAQGFDAVSVRQIAAAAEVSPALVLHHYGSKDGLRRDVDAHVAGMFDEALARLIDNPTALTNDTPHAAATFTELMLAGLPPGSPVPAYLRRLLLSGDPVGRELFTRWHQTTLQLNAELEKAGVLQPTDDPAVRAAFLIVNDLAVILLRDHLADALGEDPLSSAGMTRWATDVLAAYTRGVFKTEQE